MRGGEQDRMFIQDLKHRKYTFAEIDVNKLQFINTNSGGTFAGQYVIRGTQMCRNT